MSKLTDFLLIFGYGLASYYMGKQDARNEIVNSLKEMSSQEMENEMKRMREEINLLKSRS